MAAILLASASFLEPAVLPRHASALASRHATPTMILDQMQKAADAAKGAAAEVIIASKVEEKLAKAKEKYDIPASYEPVMKGFFTSYMTEVYKAGRDTDHYEKALTNVFKKVVENMQKPHQFQPFHEAMREPYDYYELGCEFARGVVHRETSELRGLDQVELIQQQIADGDNVVLLANHQSEADPQIFSVLLDPLYPGFAESTIFVAGDRVTTDMLAGPFSMGRNLLCIFSKKHIENPPELKSEKSKHNKNVMKKMKDMFKEGGKIIWVAPSGGRDRADESGRFRVAPFDPKSVEMFRLMGAKSGRKTHFYPLSMLTYPICPPPSAVGGVVGEERTVKFSPGGLHFASELDVEAFTASCAVDGEEPSKDALQKALSEHAHSIVNENYDELREMMDDRL